jgi:hypothetical protein
MLANGTFECSAQKVWRRVYAYNRPDVTPQDVEAMLAEFERTKMLFRWTEPDGKIWATFVGVNKPGRLPPKSREKEEKQGVPVPIELLNQFLGPVCGNATQSVAQPYRDVTEPVAERYAGSGTGSGIGSGNGLGTGSGICTATGETDTDTEPDDTPTQEMSKRTDTEPDTESQSHEVEEEIGEAGTEEFLVSLYNHLSDSKGGDLKGFRKLVKDWCLSVDEVSDHLVWAAKMGSYWPKRFAHWESSKDFCQAYTTIANQMKNWDKEQIAKVRRAVEAQLKPVPEKEEGVDDFDEIFGTVEKL